MKYLLHRANMKGYSLPEEAMKLLLVIIFLLPWSKKGFSQVPCDPSALQLVDVVPGHPCTFIIEDSCNAAQNYEIQILRLYNVDPANFEEDSIDAYVDWSTAMSYMTNGGVVYFGTNHYTIDWLTIAEGTGFYAWRVRRIYTRPKNNDPGGWGAWTSTGSYTDGSTVTTVAGDTSNTYLFYYHQFDDTLNWIYRRSFGEARDWYFATTELNEKIDYANYLLMPNQHVDQIHENNLKDKIHSIVSQTVIDNSGRPAVQTLAAPGEEWLRYHYDIAQNGSSNNYTADDFDNNTNYNDPSVMTGGISDYYSSGNSDNRIPSAEGRTFSRTLYYNDGLNRPREISSPGEMHAPDPTHNTNKSIAHTIRKFYGKATSTELIDIFADEAPGNSSSKDSVIDARSNPVLKTYTYDPNGTISVTYTDEFGRTIATALQPPGSSLLVDNLAPDPYKPQNHDTVLGKIQVGPNSYLAKATYAFAVPTEMEFLYKLTSRIYGDACLQLCGVCDYKITITCKERDDTTTFRLVRHVYPVIDSVTGSCTALDFDTTGTYEVPTSPLDVGTYDVTLLLEFNTEDPVSHKKFIDSMVETMHRRLDAGFADGGKVLPYTSGPNKYIDTMRIYAGTGDILGLMNYLGADTSLPTFKIAFNDYCDTLVLPTAHCKHPSCDTPRFSEYMKDQMAAYDTDHGGGFFVKAYTNTTNFGVAFTTDTLNLFLVESDQEFNDIIKRMVADGYDCSILWDAWVQAVEMYINGQISLAPPGAVLADTTSKYDWWQDFMQLVGYKFPYTARDYSELFVSTDSVRLKPYKFFPYDWGSNMSAEDIFCYMKNHAIPCPSTGTPPGWADSIYNFPAYNPQLENFHMYNFYKNVKRNNASATYYGKLAAISTTFNPANTNYLQALAQLNHACLKTCEDRLDPLMVSVAESVMDDWNFKVEGFVYDTWRPASTDSINLAQVYCMANAVVKECKEMCDITPDSSGYFSAAKILTIQKAMVYSVNVYAIPDGETADCPHDDDTRLVASPTSTRRELLDWLNRQNGRLRDSLAAAGILTYNWKALFDAYSIAASPANTSPCKDNSVTLSNTDGPSYFTYGTEKVKTNAACSTATVKIYRAAFDSVYKSTETTVTLYAVFNSALGATDSIILKDIIPAGFSFVSGMGPLVSGAMCYTIIGPRSAGDTVVVTYTIISGATLGTYTINGASYRYTAGAITDSCHVDGQDIEIADCINLNYTIEIGGDPVRYTLCHVCEDIDECEGEVCINWAIPDADNPDTSLREKTCGVMVCQGFLDALDNGLLYRHAIHEGRFRQNYADSCLNRYRIKDLFVNSYYQDQLFYTLYYYDRAGNLIRTVSPQDVIPGYAGSSAPSQPYTRLKKPDHTGSSQYDYTTRGKVKRQSTPDGGLVTYMYDRAGRFRFSQNDKQLSAGHFSYCKYDSLDRMIETGEMDYANPTQTDADNFDFPLVSMGITLTYRTRITYSDDYTGFSSGGGPLAGGAYQDYIENRISYVETAPDGNFTNNNDEAVTVYSYDPHGNVNYFYQWVYGMAKARLLKYNNGIITGTVNEVELLDKDGSVDYEDNIKMRFSYSKDSRLNYAFRSYDGHWWNNNWSFPLGSPKVFTASYMYNLHSLNQVRRMELSEIQQGVDYTYTLEGWLKAINHPDTASDPGTDLSGMHNGATVYGADGNETSPFRTDIFSMALHYYDGDFKHSGSQFDNSNGWFLGGSDLYNGNIKAWQTYTPEPGNGISTGLYDENVHTGYRYKYDQLNRITESAFYSLNKTGLVWSATNEYNEKFSYNKNGGVSNIERWGYDVSGPSIVKTVGDAGMDYIPGTNQPKSFLNGNAAGGPLLGDVDSFTKFTYDAVGNLASHENRLGTEDFTAAWSPYGKPYEIVDNASGKTIDYLYDGMGNRVKKAESWSGGNYDNTYYLYGPDSKLLAIYTENNSKAYGIAERHLYGLDHVGIMQGTNVGTGASIDSMGDIQYEMRDHLGNVRVTFNDKNTVSLIAPRARPEMTTYSNYYAYGALHPNRSWNTYDHRMGFNGQEKNNMIGAGNLNTAKYWEYNTRFGIRWNQDPVTVPSFSPYGTFNTNPIFFTDPDGDKVGTIRSRAKKHTYDASTWEEIKQYFYNNGLGYLIKRIESSPAYYDIVFLDGNEKSDEGSKFGGNMENGQPVKGGTLFLNLNLGHYNGKTDYLMNPAEVIGHEFGHLFLWDHDPVKVFEDANTFDAQYDNIAEKIIIDQKAVIDGKTMDAPIEQDIANKIGLGRRTRFDHGGRQKGFLYWKGKDPTDRDPNEKVDKGTTKESNDWDWKKVEGKEGYLINTNKR